MKGKRVNPVKEAEALIERVESGEVIPEHEISRLLRRFQDLKAVISRLPRSFVRRHSSFA